MEYSVIISADDPKAIKFIDPETGQAVDPETVLELLASDKWEMEAREEQAEKSPQKTVRAWRVTRKKPSLPAHIHLRSPEPEPVIINAIGLECPMMERGIFKR